MIKLAPFDLNVPSETAIRLLKLGTPRREMKCHFCGRMRPASELYNRFNRYACNDCLDREFGKSE